MKLVGLLNRRLVGISSVLGAFCALLLCGDCALATNVYVVPPGTPGAAPDGVYITWNTAATNIQDAINAINTNNGNIVYISNGVYLLTNEIAVNKGVILRSWSNGVTAPASTILDGNNYEGKPVTNRVMTLNNESAVLDGLTIQGGMMPTNFHGGGIYIYKSAMITNCIIMDNHTMDTRKYGGGLFVENAFGVITHCLIVSNTALQAGGMYIYGDSSGVVEYCTIEHNEANLNDSNWNRGGGGLILGNGVGADVVVRWCTIANNFAYQTGGGIYVNDGLVENCTIVSNSSDQRSSNETRGGSGVFFYRTATNSHLRNCLIACNSNYSSQSAVFFESAGFIENCTIVSNVKYGLRFSGYNGCTATLVNAIVYANGLGEIISGSTNYMIASNCLCSVDLPGTDNLIAAPVFADDAFRLTSDSPGINAGLNLPWMYKQDASDLDGRRRVDVMHKRADIGCYEFLYRGVMFTLR